MRLLMRCALCVATLFFANCLSTERLLHLNSAAATTGDPGIPHPVILFPGLAGSQMQAKLDRQQTAHWYCRKKSDWYRIWLDIKNILPGAINCFMDNFRLIFNNATGLTENVPGVETRLEDFGNVSTFEYFLDWKVDPAGYFHNIIQGLVNRGYQRGISLRGAPYDFRKAPYESEDHFSNLTRLVEETYSLNNGKRIVLVCHSNGCTYNYFFLLQASPQWKAQYIQSWVTLGAPLGGASEVLQAVVVGDNFHFKTYAKSLFRDLERSFSSMGSIMPVASIFGNITLLSIAGDANYTASDLSRIYRMVDDAAGAQMWQTSVDLMPSYPFPGVEVHCIRSTGLPTLETLFYESRKSFPRSPDILYGDGDGTVNRVSSDLCLQWSNEKTFHTLQYKGVNHINIVTVNETLNYLLGHVLGL